MSVPFNAEQDEEGDHFPEHRSIATSGRADDQIIGTALWEARQGMRSKCRPSGTIQFVVRLKRALQRTGFADIPSDNTDQNRYRQMYDLLIEMLEEWANAGSPDGPPAFAHNGPHTTNKLLAGFAKIGVFAIPYQCIDGDPASPCCQADVGGAPCTSDADCPGGLICADDRCARLQPIACGPGSDTGADAVIDIDDRNPENDLLTDKQVFMPTVDYLKPDGLAPKFLVWTGSRYTFDAVGKAVLANPSPCNGQFRVEVATDEVFTENLLQSDWIDVDRDPTNPEEAGSLECFGTWTPSQTEWDELPLEAGDRIYYRAFTQRDTGGADQRVSTNPASGLRAVAPPYAVITPEGEPDF